MELRSMIKEIIRFNVGNYKYLIHQDLKKFVVINKEIESEKIENLILEKGRGFPAILFIGEDLIPKVEKLNDINLIPVKKKFIEFFYVMKETNQQHRISINVNLNIEYFPVFVLYIKDYKKEPILPIPNSKVDLVVFSPYLSRLDKLQIKINFPKSRLVQAGEYKENLTEKDMNNYRITDFVDKFGMDIISKNPIYAARYYLRKLDFENLYSLPSKVFCNDEELKMILEFLRIVIENKNKSRELEIHKSKFIDLYLYYQFIYLIVSKKYQELEEFYQQNEEKIKKQIISSNIIKFISNYKMMIEQKNKRLTKEDEIKLWEIEMLLK